MIDPQASKEIIDEVKALSSEVYGDLASPALKEVGNVAGRTVKALLSPVRGMLWGWERIEEMVEEGIKKRFEKIPEENRKSPQPEIAVPLLQALSYTAQNETLREMYISLLANSMDITKDKVVHPSFVEIIRQMNTLDAKVFDKIAQDYNYQNVINPVIEIGEKKKFIINATPDWFIGWAIDGYDEFDVSASMVRLSKFGLIELMHNRTTENDSGYDELKNSSFLLNILNENKKKYEDKLEIKVIESVLRINEYGKQFKGACQN